MFSRLNRKRRASAAAQLETRRDRPFSVAPPSGGRDTDFQFEDPGFDYTDTGFDDNMGAFDNVSSLYKRIMIMVLIIALGRPLGNN